MTHDEQAQRIVTFGFTARQAGFLAAVLRHSGVCLARQDLRVRRDRPGTEDPRLLRHPRRPALRHRVQWRAPAGAHLSPAPQGPVPCDRRARYAISQADRGGAGRRAPDGARPPPGPPRPPLAGDRAREGRALRPDDDAATRELPSLTFTGGGTKTTRFFPDKLPIGVSSDRRRHVFVYLATQDVPLDFRATCTATRSCCAVAGLGDSPAHPASPDGLDGRLSGGVS